MQFIFDFIISISSQAGYLGIPVTVLFKFLSIISETSYFYIENKIDLPHEILTASNTKLEYEAGYNLMEGYRSSWDASVFQLFHDFMAYKTAHLPAALQSLYTDDYDTLAAHASNKFASINEEQMQTHTCYHQSEESKELFKQQANISNKDWDLVYDVKNSLQKKLNLTDLEVDILSKKYVEYNIELKEKIEKETYAEALLRHSYNTFDFTKRLTCYFINTELDNSQSNSPGLLKDICGWFTDNNLNEDEKKNKPKSDDPSVIDKYITKEDQSNLNFLLSELASTLKEEVKLVSKGTIAVNEEIPQESMSPNQEKSARIVFALSDIIDVPMYIGDSDTEEAIEYRGIIDSHIEFHFEDYVPESVTKVKEFVKKSLKIAQDIKERETTARIEEMNYPEYKAHLIATKKESEERLHKLSLGCHFALVHERSRIHAQDVFPDKDYYTEDEGQRIRQMFLFFIFLDFIDFMNVNGYGQGLMGKGAIPINYPVRDIGGGRTPSITRQS